MATNLIFGSELPQSTDGGPAWTHEFKVAVAASIQRWGREPETLQMMRWVKKLDAEPGKFLESFTDKS